MAYNNKNRYKRIIEIQNLVLYKKSKDEFLFLKEIYEKYVYPKYHISYRTFNSYLGINAKRELKLILQKEEIGNKNQPKLF